jgi:hypothetical protein
LLLSTQIPFCKGSKGEGSHSIFKIRLKDKNKKIKCIRGHPVRDHFSRGQFACMYRKNLGIRTTCRKMMSKNWDHITSSMVQEKEREQTRGQSVTLQIQIKLASHCVPVTRKPLILPGLPRCNELNHTQQRRRTYTYLTSYNTYTKHIKLH